MSTPTKRSARVRTITIVAAVSITSVAVVGELVYAGLRTYFFRAISPKVLPPRTPVRPFENLRGSTCGACHSAIYAEWQTSAHGRAMTDPFFLSEYETEHRLFACLRCHAPLTEQQPTTVTGFASLGPPRPREQPNPRHDPSLTAEGVTCVVCHQRGDAIAGPVELDPQSVPHATVVDPSFGANELCVRCHAAEGFPGASLQREILPTFAEHAVWRSQGGARRCVECHFPPAERALTLTTPPRAGRAHMLLGPRDRDFVRAHLAIDPPRCTQQDAHTRCEVTLTNGAGHRMPTAEPGRDLAITWQPAVGASGEHHILRRMDRIQLTESVGEDNTLLPQERRTVTVTGALGAGELTVRLCMFERTDPLLASTHTPYAASCETLARYTVDASGAATAAALPDDTLRGRF